MDSIIIRTHRPITPGALLQCRHHVGIQPAATSSALNKTWATNYNVRTGTRDKLLENYRLVHTPSGAKVSRTNDLSTRIEVSLPRLLFGDNSQLIKTQDEVDAALCRLWPIVDEVLVQSDDPSGRGNAYPNADYPYTFIGIHFAWHLPVSPDRLIRTLSNAKHPEVHRGKNDYATSIRFPGTEMVISVYDKVAQMTKNRERSDNWTRVEIQWKTAAKLKSVLGAISLEFLDFKQLYTAYRATLLKFDCPKVSTSTLAYSKPGAIAWMLANGLSAPGGGDPVCWAMGGKAPVTRGERESQRRFRRQVEGLAVGMAQFRFSDYLPEGGPPMNVPGCDERWKA